MAKNPKKPLTEFEREFLARTAEARKGIGYSQEQMAEALGISQGRYKHYEKRTLLSPEFVARFCLITRRSLDWLFTARERREKYFEHEDR